MAREKIERLVVSFASTFDAMEAERLCGEARLEGRIIPLPVEIDSECGLAWSMPASDEALRAFHAAVEGQLVPQGAYRLML